MATRDEILRFLIKAEGADDLKQLATELDKLAKSGDGAEEDITAFVAELDKLAKIDRSITALTRLKVSLADTGTNLERARQRVDELEKEFAQAEKPTAKLSRELDKARAAVEQLGKQQNRQTAELNRNSAALNKAGIDTERLGSAQRQVRQDITNLSDRFGRYSTQLRDAGAGAERAAKGTRELGAAAKATGGDLAGVEIGLGKIAAAAGGAVVALQGIQFGGSLLADSAALQTSLAEVQAIAGAGAEEFAQLRAAAEDAAASTGIAIGDVTAGLGELARAGFETQDTMAALRPALDLAQAGSLSLSEAVEITATTLTQFGEGADQAGRVADVLAEAANKTQSSVQGLGRSLTDVAPLARQLDISFEETVAILGRLSDEGFRGSRAGTALRSAFAQLLDPSSKFREELGKLGITSTDFTAVLEELATKGDAGRDALLSLGQEAAPAILALASKGGGAIRALTADLQGAEGSANAVAQAIRDTLGNAFNRLEQTAGNAIRQLIDPLLKPLQSLLQDVTARLAAFAASEDFAKIRDGLALAFENGIETVRQFLDSADFAQLTQDVQTFAAEAGKSFADLRENVDALVSGFNAVGAAIRVLGNGIQLGLSAAESNLLSLERRLLSTTRTVLELSNSFGFVDEELAQIEARLAEVDRRQTVLLQNGERDWGQLKDAAADFGAAVSGADAELAKLTTKSGPIDLLAGKIQGLAQQFGLIPPAVQQAADQIGLLPEVVAGTAEQIEASNEKAARSFSLPADASRKALEDILAQWRGIRTALEQQVGAIQRSLSGAFDDPELTAELQAKLAATQGELGKTEAAIKQAETALANLGDEADRTGPRLGDAGRQGVQAFGELSGAIDQTRSSFETYQEAESRAADQSEQFAADKRVYTIRQLELEGELLDIRRRQIEAEGRLIQSGVSTSIYEAAVRRNLETLREYGEELDRISARSEALRQQEQAIQEKAEAERLARINASLQQAEQLTQTEERRAVAQQAAAAAITAQLTATRELVSLRERNANTPERVEVVIKNEQQTADQLLELVERNIDRIGLQVASAIGAARAGTFGR
jgi:TP901 family phage tail tape measure protein